jgi:phospholipase C
VHGISPMRSSLPAVLVVVMVLLASCAQIATETEHQAVPPATPSSSLGGRERISPAQGLRKIDHLIFIVQENRSFDHYFGTFPGADGIPMRGGRPAVCVPDPVKGTCTRPFHDSNFVDAGGPHDEISAKADVNHGRMDGFIRTAHRSDRRFCRATPADPACRGQIMLGQNTDVMGYHDGREIPNYWTYATRFVLQDHMFESAFSWSLPSHLFTVSGWSATCSNAADPMTCTTDLVSPGGQTARTPPSETAPYAWTDITYLLHRAGVSWRYYTGTPAMRIWNPLPMFRTVREDGELGNIQPVDRFARAALKGTLPAVSWVVPGWRDSEHPPTSVRLGQAFVTRMVNAVMRGPGWSRSAIFVTWDDWGGFYDHVLPPAVDESGYGLRVPGLLISPYAKAGMIDHQILSFDAYLKLIEDRFLGGQRLDPRTDGRPDARPTVREDAPILGDLVVEFDFSQRPLRPVVLPVFPPPGRR